MGGLAKEKVTEVTWGSNPATHVKAVGVGIGIGGGGNFRSVFYAWYSSRPEPQKPWDAGARERHGVSTRTTSSFLHEARAPEKPDVLSSSRFVTTSHT